MLSRDQDTSGVRDVLYLSNEVCPSISYQGVVEEVPDSGRGATPRVELHWDEDPEVAEGCWVGVFLEGGHETPQRAGVRRCPEYHTLSWPGGEFGQISLVGSLGDASRVSDRKDAGVVGVAGDCWVLSDGGGGARENVGELRGNGFLFVWCRPEEMVDSSFVKFLPLVQGSGLYSFPGQEDLW